MKANLILTAAALSLILGIAAPIHAQEQQHEEQKDKSARPEQKQAQSEEKKASPDKPEQREEKQAQQEKSNQHEPQHAQQAKEQKEEHHEQAAQHAGGNGRGRITEAHFHANFGREHVFIIHQPVIVAGSPRFQYGGYWFGYGEPWPVGWYYTDNVYVDYIDGGYYLYNPVHPGIRISINLF